MGSELSCGRCFGFPVLLALTTSSPPYARTQAGGLASWSRDHRHPLKVLGLEPPPYIQDHSGHCRAVFRIFRALQGRSTTVRIGMHESVL